MQPHEFLAARVAEAKAEVAKPTPGSWKTWGMDVMADLLGDSNVDNAVLVARTVATNDAGSPRTWDANHIVAWDPPRVLSVLEGYERILERHRRYGQDDLETMSGHIRNSAIYVALGEVIIDLAYPWKHHPDWNPEWEVKG